MSQDDDKKKKNRKLFTEELQFSLCPTHNQRYPKGGSCPKCEQQRSKGQE